MGERFNFTLDDDSSLDELSDVTKRKKADVIRDALALYQYFVRRIQKEKAHIYVGGADKENLTEVAHTTLERLRSSGN